MAREWIPGGTGLYSKRADIFGEGFWPSQYDEATGYTVRIGGRNYTDWTHCGVGASILGYGDPEVDEAVKAAIDRGAWCSIPSRDEEALARELIDLHPGAHSAIFTRGGGEAMALAVRIARATTGRLGIWTMVGSYHGWHDWAQEAKGTAGVGSNGAVREFDGVTSMAEEAERTQGPTVAAIILEGPRPGWQPPVEVYKRAGEIAQQLGALFIIDEVTSGFRFQMGAWSYGRVATDLLVFGKALGNGYPIAAVIGSAAAMKGAAETFASSSMWTDGIGLAAGVATIKAMRKREPWFRVERAGEEFKDVLGSTIGKAGGCVTGMPQMVEIRYQDDPDNVIATYVRYFAFFSGHLLGPTFYPMAVHAAPGKLGPAEGAHKIDQLRSDLAFVVDIAGDRLQKQGSREAQIAWARQRMPGAPAITHFRQQRREEEHLG